MDFDEIEELYKETPLTYKWGNETRMIKYNEDRGHYTDYLLLDNGELWVQRLWVNSHDIKSALKTRVISE